MLITTRIIIAMIIVIIAFLAVLWVSLVVYGLSVAFGAGKTKSNTSGLTASLIPTVLGFLFVIHTLWSARTNINYLEATC